MNELDQLRAEAEQLKNAIRVSTNMILLFLLELIVFYSEMPFK